MLDESYQMVAAREQMYWWHRARRTMSVGLLKREGLAPGCRAVDLGCGTGGNLAMLAPFTPSLVVGVDRSPIALAHARAKRSGATLLQADLMRGLPFANGVFDVVTIFNVLYHQWVTDESAVLTEVRRILRPGGALLATEPAFPSLTRALDRAVMTRRRFRAGEYAELCRAVGLEVKALSYFTSFGAPAAWLMGNVKNVKNATGDMKPLHPLLNQVLYLAARAEAAVIGRGFRVPFGVTLVCVARKPSH